ncbi:MAG: ABC transporter permease subunit [Elusimicrobiales bacterium]|nr:ABC transporter permease subunit [Elusimicrobiales bacterium]
MKIIDFKNTVILINKEMKHYLNTAPAYILISIFLLITGYFFAQPLFLTNEANLNSLTEIIPLILTFFAPALSMRLIAEEKKTQTIEVLLTLPFTEEEIIISKYISASIIIISSIIFMFPYVTTLYFLSSPDTGHIVGSLASIVLCSLSFLSIGVFASTISSSQITAFIIGFGISFVFYLVGKVAPFMPLHIQGLISYIGIDLHISNMARGVIDIKDIIYFFSLIIFFIYLGICRLKNMRIR